MCLDIVFWFFTHKYSQFDDENVLLPLLLQQYKHMQVKKTDVRSAKCTAEYNALQHTSSVCVCVCVCVYAL